MTAAIILGVAGAAAMLWSRAEADINRVGLLLFIALLFSCAAMFLILTDPK